VIDMSQDSDLRELFRRWLALHRGRPALLYHYTNAAGLLGMLKSKKIWATNSRFLNDPTEMSYAIQLVRAVAQSELGSSRGPQIKRLREEIFQMLYRYERESMVHVACFCAEGDLLSQWRGYGAVGGGYSVGVLTRYLGAEHALNPDVMNPGPFLRKVFYNRKVQVRIITSWVRALSAVAKAGKRSSKGTETLDERLGMRERCFESFLGECLNCFKDPAYAAEQEWRLIRLGRWGGPEIGAADFRASGSRLVPYVELDVTPERGTYKGKLPVRIIRFGPTLDPTPTGRSLRLLCGAQGYTVHDDIGWLWPSHRADAPRLKIIRSGVPFAG
jgi:hypothetical protein